jgi:hypothetical protein
MYFIILHYFLAFHLNIFHIFEKENEFLAGGGREGGMAGGGGLTSMAQPTIGMAC